METLSEKGRREILKNAFYDSVKKKRSFKHRSMGRIAYPKNKHAIKKSFSVFKWLLGFFLLGVAIVAIKKYPDQTMQFLSKIFTTNIEERLTQDVYKPNYEFEYKYWAFDYLGSKQDEYNLNQAQAMNAEELNTVAAVKKEKDTDTKGSEKAENVARFVRPLEGAISSGFGMRLHPIKARREMHNGVDIKGDEGEVFLATSSGTVIETGFETTMGNYIRIQHEAGFTSHYMHASKILVKKDQFVNVGEKIGLVGSTGYAQGPHLHFEIRENNQPIDPRKIISF